MGAILFGGIDTFLWLPLAHAQWPGGWPSDLMLFVRPLAQRNLMYIAGVGVILMSDYFILIMIVLIVISCRKCHRRFTSAVRGIHNTIHPKYYTYWALSQYKDGLFRFRDFHFEDKTVVKLPYLFNGNTILVRRHLNIKTALWPRFVAFGHV